MPLGGARNGCGDCIVQKRLLLNGHDLQRWTRPRRPHSPVLLRDAYGHLDMPTRSPGTGFFWTRPTRACNATRGHCPEPERTPGRGQTPRLRKTIPTPPTATAKMATSAIAGTCHRADVQPPHPRAHPRSATQPIRGQALLVPVLMLVLNKSGILAWPKQAAWHPRLET